VYTFGFIQASQPLQWLANQPGTSWEKEYIIPYFYDFGNAPVSDTAPRKALMDHGIQVSPGR
jgi:hypothetical protein